MNHLTPPNFDYTAFELPENVSFTFHLGHHFNAADLPDWSVLDKTLRTVDIVIPEFVHDAGSKNVMAAIAMGRQKEYQQFQADIGDNDMGGWLHAFASSLYGSRTSTANIDVMDTHPAVDAYIRTEPAVRRAAAWSVRERFDDIVPILNANLATIKERDQAILENLKPEIEAIISKNGKLMKKREGQPLDVHLYYGATHTSLFDAIAFQQTLTSTEGVTLNKSSDSLENELSQLNYANFVRDQDIQIEDVERNFAYLIFASHIKRLGFSNNNVSMRALQDSFFSIENALDLSSPTTIPKQIDEILRLGLLDISS